jgi:nicotinamidase-related amidase
MKSLLIIDMQKGSFTAETPRCDAINVINRINKLSGLFRKKGFPVIFIQHNGVFQNEFIPKTKEWELLDELTVKDVDYFVEKFVNDSFYHSELENKLNELHINELFVTGCATDFCVNSTIQSAYVKEYRMTVVSDGHTTADRPELDAEKIINYFNWLWENMTPVCGGIKVMKTDMIISELLI